MGLCLYICHVPFYKRYSNSFFMKNRNYIKSSWSVIPTNISRLFRQLKFYLNNNYHFNQEIVKDTKLISLAPFPVLLVFLEKIFMMQKNLKQFPWMRKFDQIFLFSFWKIEQFSCSNKPGYKPAVVVEAVALQSSKTPILLRPRFESGLGLQYWSFQIMI